MRQAGRVLSQSRKLWVRAGAGENPGIAFGEGVPTLALQRPGDDNRPAACGAGVDDLVNEVDQLVGKSNSDLLAHPKMVANWEQPPPGRRAKASWPHCFHGGDYPRFLQVEGIRRSPADTVLFRTLSSGRKSRITSSFLDWGAEATRTVSAPDLMMKVISSAEPFGGG